MDYIRYSEELMKRLVSIPSESQNEEAVAKYLGELFKSLGLKTILRRLDGKSYNVVATYGNKSRKNKKLLLGGHIDTVCADPAWAIDPLSVKEENGNFYGLGCGDMKGGLACQIAVLKKIIDEGYALDGEIEFACLCDEERHSIGAMDYVKQQRANCQPPADFGIFAEPHFENIVVGATGKVYLKIEIHGVTGHAATPEKGVNAISCMAMFIQAIDKKYGELYRHGKTGSHAVLRIESKYTGYSLSIPDSCFCMINKQLDTEETPESFIEDLERIYATQVCKGTLSISREIPYYPSYLLEKNNQDFQLLLRTIEQEDGFKPELRVNQSVSDGNILYHELGIPVVLFGPQGVDFHKAGEYVTKETIARYINVLEKFIKRFFETEI